MPVFASVTSPQMSTDPPLRDLGFRIVAGIEDLLLNITEDRLYRIVVGTTLGQADPMQAQGTHRPAGLSRFAGMGRILI